MPARPSNARSDEARIRAAIVAAGRRLGARGLISAGEGNISARLSAGDLLITPSGRRKDELRDDELLVTALIHAHLPAAMALTLAGEVPDPTVLPETTLFLPRLPYVPFATAGSSELAAAIAAALSSGGTPLPGAALLERHGAVAVGGGDPVAAIDQALIRLELVEVLCGTWRDALLIRAATSARSGRAILRPPSTGPGAWARGSSRRKS
jgi:L-fuculose-phosphate aldolase